MPGTDWIEGRVRWFDDLKGEGLVKDLQGNSYYVHYSSIIAKDTKKKRKTLKKDKKVEFRLFVDSHFTQIAMIKEC